MSGIIRTYDGSDQVLRPLIGLLNDFWKPGAPNPIPELAYLNQMSETGRLPEESFYPRAIITYMVNKCKTVWENVRHVPRLAIKLQCQYFEEGHWRVYEFSNTMFLYIDIIILQYLYIYRMTRCDFPRQLRELTTLMTSKYTIHEDVNCSTCKINCETCETICENRNCFRNDPKMVTFGRIFRSYVSVTLWMYNYLPEFTKIVRTVFPKSSLPGMICSWYFSLVLPCRRIRLNCKFLLAMNLVFCAAYDTMSPTLSIYRRIVEYCTVSYDVYTEEMRIDICIKLGILMKLYNRYSFSSILQMHRFYYEIAKETISKYKENDVTVDEMFEQMDQLVL